MDCPSASASPQKRAREEIHLGFPSPKRSRIAQWLSDLRQPSPTSYHFHRRTRSAPDQFTGHSDQKIYQPQDQLSHFDVESTELASTKEDAEAFTEKNSKRAVSTASNYISTLWDHGIEIDPEVDEIPTQLDAFLRQSILTGAEEGLVSEQAHREICGIRARLANSNETLVSKLYSSPMFPSIPRGIVDEGKTVWDTTALPHPSGVDCTLIAPTSDFYLAYASTKHCPFSVSQKAIIDHAASRPFAKPAKKHAFPFLVVKMKSDAAGGTLAKAEFDAAASGAACVNGVRWYLKDANMREELEKVESSIAFSICMNHRLAALYVHWNSGGEEPRFVMSMIDEFLISKIEDVRRCATAIANIHKWAQGARNNMITTMLQNLVESPPDWALAASHERGAASERSTAERLKTNSAASHPNAGNSAASRSTDVDSVEGISDSAELASFQHTGPRLVPQSLPSPSKSYEVA